MSAQDPAVACASGFAVPTVGLGREFSSGLFTSLPTCLFLAVTRANPAERGVQAALPQLALLLCSSSPSPKYGSGILPKRRCLEVEYLAVDGTCGCQPYLEGSPRGLIVASGGTGYVGRTLNGTCLVLCGSAAALLLRVRCVGGGGGSQRQLDVSPERDLVPELRSASLNCSSNGAERERVSCETEK